MKKIIISTFVILALTGCSSSFFDLDEQPQQEPHAQKDDAYFDSQKIIRAQSYATPTRPFLMNSNWKVSQVNNQTINPQFNLTLQFRNNIYNRNDFLISGNSGCNSYQGHASLEIMQGRLHSNPDFLSTRMFCADKNLENIEKEFLKAIFSNTNIERNGEQSIIIESRSHKFTLIRI